MYIKNFLFITATPSLFTLSGCGFHLRGSITPYVLPFTTVIISPDDPFNPVYKPLRHRLQTKKIKVISRCADFVPDMTIPSISILDYKLTQIPFAYGPDGEIRREKMIFKVQYQYQEKNKIRIGYATARRFRQLNLDQNLADEAEKVIIEKEMVKDVVDQILVQLTVTTWTGHCRHCHHCPSLRSTLRDPYAITP